MIESSLSAFDAFAPPHIASFCCGCWRSLSPGSRGLDVLKPAGLQAGVGWNAALHSLNALLCLVLVAVFMPLLCLQQVSRSFLGPVACC